MRRLRRGSRFSYIRAALGLDGAKPVTHEHLRFRDGKSYWDLLDYFYVKSFQRGYPSWVIGQESDSLQIQIGKDLSSQADFALNLALAFGMCGQTPFAMKRENRLVPDFLCRE